MQLSAPGQETLPESLLKQGLLTLLVREGVASGELSVTFLGDEPMRELNRDHLHHDWVPDVLSFALHGDGEPLLGDVYVGFDQAYRQAAEHGIEVEEELLRLAVHGALHVLGHDHPEGLEERESSEMYRIQERVVREAMSGGTRPVRRPPP